MTKIAVIADPHIGINKQVFVENWHRAVSHVNMRGCALTVVLGDLTFDAANSQPDLDFAKAALSALNGPCLVLPGNHDVGDVDRASRQPANADRITRWTEKFGPDYWLCDSVPCWRLVGIDSQILGTGLEQEEAQWAFLETALRSDRRTVLFTHQPLFLEHWDEDDRPYWATCGLPRQRMRKLLELMGTSAVVSAHMHRALAAVPARGPALFWTPATSFLTRNSSMPAQHGTEIIGVTIIDLCEHGMTVGFDPVPGREIFYIEDFHGSLYPAPAL